MPLFISERTSSVHSRSQMSIQSSESILRLEHLDSCSSSHFPLLLIKFHVLEKVISLSELILSYLKLNSNLTSGNPILLKHEGALKSRKCHKNVNNVYICPRQTRQRYIGIILSHTLARLVTNLERESFQALAIEHNGVKE